MPSWEGVNPFLFLFREGLKPLIMVVTMMKTRSATIRIKDGTVLGSRDGHVLVYSERGDYYYSVTLASLLANERGEIEAMKKEISEFKAEQESKTEAFSASEKANRESFESEAEAKYQDFKSSVAKDRADFLKKYQESMTTLTELVKAAIKE